MNIRLLLLAVLVLVLVGCARVTPETSVGYEYRQFDIEHQHQTHPDDAGFLEGDNAGTTRIRRSHWLKLTGRVVQEELLGVKRLESYEGISGLLAVSGSRDEKKNENDPRPYGSHSAIYSEVFPFAPQVSTGLRYRITDRLAIGPEATATYFRIEHGWNRYGKDESSASEDVFSLGVGPVVSYRLVEDLTLEGRVAAETEGWSAGLGLVWQIPK